MSDENVTDNWDEITETEVRKVKMSKEKVKESNKKKIF